MKLAAILTVTILLTAGAHAAIRPAEPVLITGDALTGLAGAPVADLHLFAFVDGDWREIPMQIDELNGGSYFVADDGLWDADDELVFQPQDGGVAALLSDWIEDAESQSYPRLELVVNDAVEGDATFAYLFRSSTLPDTLTASHIAYDAGLDQVSTGTYLVGHDDGVWFWDELRLHEDGGYSDDYMDREKTRLRGYFLFQTWVRTEQDMTPVSRDVKAGPVRVIRVTDSTFSVFGTTSNWGGNKHFYGAYLTNPRSSFEVPLLGGLNLVRQSYDLNPGVIDVVESSQHNASLPVDGSPDGAVTGLTYAEMADFWVKIGVGDGAWIQVSDFQGLSDTIDIYHHDNAGGGTADGLSDTGDMMSYGDIGLLMSDPVVGTHETETKTYISATGDLSGADCQAWFNSPLAVAVTQEEYDPGLSADEIPHAGRLLVSNHPNPFNPSTEIHFDAPETGAVRVGVYDVSGRLVRTLLDEIVAEGEGRVRWDGRSDDGVRVGSGVYFCRVTQGGRTAGVKMLMLE